MKMENVSKNFCRAFVMAGVWLYFMLCGAEGYVGDYAFSNGL